MAQRRPAFVAGDIRMLAMLAGVAVAVLAAAILDRYGAKFMKRLITLVAIAATAVSLSACASVPGLTVDTKATPAVQEKQAATNDYVQRAVIDRLDHCELTGTLTVKVGVAADTGFGNTFGMTCPPKPWDTPAKVVPLSQLGLDQAAASPK